MKSRCRASCTTHSRPSLRFSPVMALHWMMVHRCVWMASSCSPYGPGQVTPDTKKLLTCRSSSAPMQPPTSILLAKTSRLAPVRRYDAANARISMVALSNCGGCCVPPRVGDRPAPLDSRLAVDDPLRPRPRSGHRSSQSSCANMNATSSGRPRPLDEHAVNRVAAQETVLCTDRCSACTCAARPRQPGIRKLPRNAGGLTLHSRSS